MPFILTTHPARQVSRANLRRQVTCGFYPSSMASPTSGFGPASSSGPAFTASGFDPASGSGPAFNASGFGPAFGFWPRIGLRPHFWASAPHRASVQHLLLSGPGPAFTTFGLRPSIYYIQVLTPRIYYFQAHLKSKIDLDSNSSKRYSEEQV
ncbi:hypothetical protein CRG98_038151 [Punica granatum]|uniref:Uncharacterized protein n=1 Tax=Punica granatum TaxID=22663 RepID=A0A2I0IBT3_PUNGR|nr:hypothetical protein CRG98_038151 [Punica granatum]